MITFLKSPVRSLFGAIAKSVPSSWFFRGEDAPGRAARTSVGKPYAESSWVFAALNLISQPIGSARLRMMDDEGQAIEERGLVDFWRAPARGTHEDLSLSEMVDQVVMLRGVAGGAFVIMDDSWLLNTPALYNKLILAAPSQMMPVWEGRTLAGWQYRDGAGKSMTLLREQVIHLKLSNPDSPDSLDGIPPWKPARPAVEAARASGKYAKRVMDQNGDRGSIINVRSGMPTPAQKEMLLAELAEKRRAAERGEFRDSVIGGGDIEVISPKLSAVSSEFSGQVAMSRDEIFVAYGVPASMAGQVASYSVGAASDWYRLITGTCSREAAVIAEAMARISEYRLGWRSLFRDANGSDGAAGRRGEDRRVKCEFDFSGHPVMAEVRAGRVEQLSTLFRMGVPVEVANDFLALGLPEYAGWQERWLPVSFAPVSMISEPLPDAAEKSVDDPELVAAVRNWSAKRTQAKTAETVKGRAQSADRAARWKRVDAARTADRARVSKLMTRHLMAARAETLRNLKEVYAKGIPATGSEYAIRAGVIDIAFDVTRWFSGMWGDLSRVLGGIWRTASEGAAEEADEVRDESGGDYDPLTEADPRVVAALGRRQNLMKGVSDDMHAKLVASLEEGIEAGETLDELTARVRTLFSDFSRVRAEVVARTETGAAYEGARYLTFKDAGITQKGWLSGGDDGVTRATHEAADGQVRPIDDPFEVGEAKLMHPHDQVGGASYPQELINCRCVLTAEG